MIIITHFQYQFQRFVFNLSLFPLAKVGKTSLIMSLVGEEFPEEVT